MREREVLGIGYCGTCLGGGTRGCTIPGVMCYMPWRGVAEDVQCPIVDF